MIITLLICALTISISTFAFLIHAYKLISFKLDMLVADAHGNAPTSYDVEREQADEEFNERIENMKIELAEQQAQYEAESTVAEVMHPNVVNLPHNKIPNDRVPDVEYAD